MISHGCYGVRFEEIDYLTGTNFQFFGVESSLIIQSISPERLGVTFIKEIQNVLIRDGYDNAIEMWKIQTKELLPSNMPPSSPNIVKLLSGRRININNLFILDSYACNWAYIMNLDTEKFEIYKGGQKHKHEYGRYCDRFVDAPEVGFLFNGQPSYLRQKQMKETFYPCALLLEIDLRDLLELNLLNYIIPE